MTTFTETFNPKGLRIVTIRVVPQDLDHHPPVLSASRGDLIAWEPAAGFDGAFTIQSIEKVGFLDRPPHPDAPDFPFPIHQKARLKQDARGMHWGPADPAKHPHLHAVAYKYAIQVGTRTVDPHIIISNP